MVSIYLEALFYDLSVGLEFEGPIFMKKDVLKI